MSFGWSSGDLAILAGLCLKIYRFWKNAEYDLKDVLQRFEYARQQLISLEDLLNETGWKAYPYASELKQDLESHYEFFTKLPGLSGQPDRHGKIVHSKAKDKAKLGFKIDNLVRIKGNIEDHRARLNDFKQDIVLQVLLHKSRNQNSVQVRSADSLSQFDTKSNFSDPASVLSKAQKSLEIAARINKDNLESRRKVSTESPDATPKSLSRAQKHLRNYIEEVVGAAESQKLYAHNVSLSNHLDDLVKIGNALDDIKQKFSTESPALTRSLTLLTIPSSPQTLVDSIRDGLATSHNEVRQFWETITPPPSLQPPTSPRTQMQEDRETDGLPLARPPSHFAHQQRADRNITDTAHSLSLGPAHPEGAPSSAEDDATNESRFEARDDSSRSSTDSDDDGQPHAALRLLGKAYIGGHRLLGRSIVERRLVFSLSEASACIHAHPTSRRMTPSELFSQRTPEESRIFRHAFEHGLDAYPRIHHPFMEKVPAHANAPFKIEFVTPQIANAEGDPRPAQPATALHYLFEHREDRDHVREVIFGKTHLASAGVQEVSHNKTHVCDLESITLWRSNNATEDLENVFTEGSAETTVTITVPEYSKHNRDPERIAEYTILFQPKLSKSIQEARRPRKTLILDIQPILSSTTPSPSCRTDSFSPQSTTRAESFVSQTSTLSRFRRRSSTPKDVLYITFSEDDDESVLDKRSFLDRLAEAFLERDEARDKV